MSGILSKKFHKKTNFDFAPGTVPRNPQYWPKDWKEIQYKEYPRLPKIILPDSLPLSKSLQEVLRKRHSAREYDPNQEITLEELTTLIAYSAGIKPSKEPSPLKTDKNILRRHYPSGGALYPLELYLACQRVCGIPPGIYHYNVNIHSLECLSDDSEEIHKIKEGLYYPWSYDSAVMFFITSVWDRNFKKYHDRGYRIVLLEAGHLAQNISLCASALDLKCCNSVGFSNIKINKVLDIETEVEDTLYLALIGK